MEKKEVSAPSSRFFIFLLAGAAVLVTLFWGLEMNILRNGPSYGDEGFVAEAARRITRGEVPYRDFLNGVTPGAYYFYALLFFIFGPTFLALRLGVVLTALLILLGTWWVLRSFGLSRFTPFAMVATYFAYYAGPYWFIASYHWLAAAFCLISLGLLLVEKEDATRYWYIAAAGGFATLAAFTLQHKGVLWMLAATIGLLALRQGERQRALLWFWGGILAVALPLVVGFVAVVGWDTLVSNLITFPLTQYHKVAAHRGNLQEYLGKTWKVALSAWLYRENFVDWVRILAWNTGFLGHLFVHLFPLLGGGSLLALWRGGRIAREKLALLLAFFVASYLGALHRLSDSTLGFAAPAAVLAIILFLYECQCREDAALVGYKQWAIRAWLLLFTTVTIAYGTVGLLSQKIITQTPAGEVASVMAGEAETMEGVMAFMRDHRQPGEKIFCYNYLAIFYFLLQADNPTPYDLLTYPINTQEQLDHAQSLLEADKTRWVLWNHVPLDSNSFGRYLDKSYVVKARFKYISIMERRER